MNNNLSPDSTEPQMFVNNAQYIKDLSFENPDPFTSLTMNITPKVDVSIDVDVKRLQENSFEVTLTVNTSALAEENTLFMVELKYAGIFSLTNIPEDQMEPILLVNCPSLLFPFARRVIADVTRDGGFQPLMINPIDFYALYYQKKQQQTEEVPLQ